MQSDTSGHVHFWEYIQYKVENIPGDCNDVNNYIYDILVLINDDLPKHIYQIRVIFDSLCSSGMKFNAPKLGFWSKKIP